MNTLYWRSGLNDYRQHSFSIDSSNNIYHLELLNTEHYLDLSIDQLFAEHVQSRSSKHVGVLYSGGLDSECVLRSLAIQKIPQIAYTLRLLLNGYSINTHDLYYSEKFCRMNHIEQRIIDLDVDKFFEGTHHSLLEKYRITQFHVSTHFWLIKQIDDFVVMGGDYNWPWHDKRILSPQRHNYGCYDLFLKDIAHEGIGNMLSHSMSSNLLFIKHHLDQADSNFVASWTKLPLFKAKLLESMGLGTFEPRLRSYGWENMDDMVIDYKKINQDLIKAFGNCQSRITWNSDVAKVLNSLPASNTQYL
jgi:hypothetical protein